MLAFLCGNDEDLTEVRYCSVRELRSMLRNRWNGVEVSLEEATEVHAMIHENDSGEEEDSEEEAETACGRGCSIEDDDRVENQCSPCNPDRNTIQQFNCCPMKHYNLRDLCMNRQDLLLSTWDLNIDELREGLIEDFPGLQLTDEEARVLHDEIHEEDVTEEEEEVEDSEAPPPEPEPLSDTRPLINEEWRRNNRERWKELMETPEHCPVCLESEDVIWDGKLNYGEPTKCTHWFCHECFGHIQGMNKGDRRRRCPLCKDAW